MEPTVYDRNVALLVRTYKSAITAISAELQRLDVSDMSRANAKVALSEVAKILRDVNEESALWVEANIPKAAIDGVVTALVDLKIVATVDEAAKIAKFNRINREFVATAIADTQADLLAVTQNVERRVRTAVRQATAESFRANMSRGINGRKTIDRDILAGIRKTLGTAVDTGIVDSAGRRWKPDDYVDMLTRTKMSATRRETTTNEAVGRGAYYAQISRHGAKDACGKWEGRVVKLVRDAPGDYPYIGDIDRRSIFHPRCKHSLSPIRDPELLAE